MSGHREAVLRPTRRSLLAVLPAAAAGAAAITLPAAAHAAPENRPVSICYVEVNDHELASVGRYTLSGSSTPVYDVAIIFAANIDRGEDGHAVLHLNEKVRATLHDAAHQIRPLQEQGITVLLSVLGNHQGAGFANFPDQATAADFARQLAEVVEEHGLDGIDFDDEYAEYGADGTGQPNDSSFVHLVTALRAELGTERLITLYNIGESAARTVDGDVRLGDTFDYAWNPYYATWAVPQIPGMGKGQLSPAAVKIADTPASTAADYARRTVSEGYGVYLTYDLDDEDRSEYLSAFTQELYGAAAVRDA